MPTVDLEQQRQFAVEVVRRLRGEGFDALWAGGCVRDRLLGLIPKDYDVATDATPEQVRNLFGRRRTLAIGAAFGVISVLGPPGAGQIDVATFRSDVSYSDGRHPDQVVYCDARHDAERRDFTINGLFFDPLAEKVIDYVGGQDDLARGIVRAIGDPRCRFAEDKLRMLRAVRFTARFGFQLDPATQAAIAEMAAEIVQVSPERIAQEMRPILVAPRREWALELMRQVQLLSKVLPEIVSLDTIALPPEAASLPESVVDTSSKYRSGWERLLSLVARLEEPGFPLALAASLYPVTIAKPRSGGDQAADRTPARNQADHLVREVGARWRLSNDETDRAAWLLAHAEALRGAATQNWSRLQRVLREPGAGDLIKLHQAIAETWALAEDDAAFCRERLSWPRTRLDPPPLITGEDLLRLNIPRGKLYRKILDALRDQQLDQRIERHDQALRLAEQLWEESRAK